LFYYLRNWFIEIKDLSEVPVKELKEEWTKILWENELSETELKEALEEQAAKVSKLEDEEKIEI
jgi:hypothetical protein